MPISKFIHVDKKGHLKKFSPSSSVPVKFFTQGVMKTIRGVTNLAASGLVRVVTRVSNGCLIILIIKFLLCLCGMLKESLSS